MASATLLPLATFLLHSAPSVPDSSKTPQIFEFHDIYVNLTLQSLLPFQYHHLSLPCINFSVLFYTPQQTPTVTFRSPSDSPHTTKSSAYKRPGNLHPLLSPRNLTPLLPIPIFTSFITASIYTLNKLKKKVKFLLIILESD